MGSISDRDKKIILGILILMVTILPYVFYIKDTKIQTETVLTNVATLQAEYDNLKAMDQNREFYIEETERMHEERDVIIASFPAGIRRENYTMFLLQTEYSSDVVTNEETGEPELQYPIIFDTVSFADNVETSISSENTDTGLVALSNTSTVSYRCYYDGMKYLLDYLMNYEDPMIYTAIEMSFDEATGVVSGTMNLAQYAISGPDRILPDVDFDIQIGDDKESLGLDDLELRGNEEVGIFGPIVVTEVPEEEAVPEEGAPEAEE